MLFDQMNDEDGDRSSNVFTSMSRAQTPVAVKWMKKDVKLWVLLVVAFAAFMLGASLVAVVRSLESRLSGSQGDVELPLVALGQSAEVFTTAEMTTVHANEIGCPDGFYKLRQFGCYQFGDKVSVDWHAAVNYCKTINSSLVSIETQEEQLAIAEYLEKYHTPEEGTDRCLRDSGTFFWIGLHDVDKEAVFTWLSNGKTPTFNNWTPGQPDNWGQGEDCAHIHDKKRQFKWNDQPCTTCLAPICEIAML